MFNSSHAHQSTVMERGGLKTVTCYTSSTTCTSTNVSLTGTRPAGQCCLNRGGRSYRASSSTACTPCVIYRFFQFTYSTAPSTTVYQKEGSQLTGYFGFVNGTHSVLSLSRTIIDTSNDSNPSLSSAATRLQVTLNIIPDNIALQPPSMVPVSALVDTSNEFVLPFNADADGRRDMITADVTRSDTPSGSKPPHLQGIKFLRTHIFFDWPMEKRWISKSLQSQGVHATLEVVTRGEELEVMADSETSSTGAEVSTTVDILETIANDSLKSLRNMKSVAIMSLLSISKRQCGVIIGFEKQSYQISKHQNQGCLPVKIQVLQGTLGRTILLHVNTRDGSAIASKNYFSTDYDLPALNFSVHELTVNVSIIVNDLAEDDKVISVELSLIFPSSRVAITPRSAQVTIVDDNAPQHFIASSVRLTIPPYTPPQTELCVAFTILDNKVALEPNKTFSIKVMPSPKVVLLRPISHVLIVDNDAVSVNFTSSNYTSVGSGYTAVCVSKDAATASNINVEITLTSANASCSEFLNSNFVK
eukprot:Em0010g143a